MTDNDKLMIDRPFVNPFYNEAVGRRTGWVQKKEARKDSDGFEIFDDYWSDSDQSSLSVEATNKQNRTRNKTLDPVVITPNIRKSSPLKAMSSFSTEHLSTEKSSKSCVTSYNASEVVTPKAVLEEDGLQGSLSKVDTSNVPNSALQSFKTKKRLTFSAAEHLVQRRTLNEQEANQPESIDVKEQCEQEDDNLDKTLVADVSDHETTASQVATSNEANVETECIIHNEIQSTSQHVPISFRKTRGEAERSHQSTSRYIDDIDSDFVSFKKKSVTHSTNFEDNDDDDYDFEIIDIDTTVYSQESGSNEASRTSKDIKKLVSKKIQTAKKSDRKKENRTKKKKIAEVARWDEEENDKHDLAIEVTGHQKKIAEVARWDEEENDKHDLAIEVTGHQKKKKETLMNKKNESGSSSDVESDSNLSNVRTRRRNKKQDSLREKNTKIKTNKKSEIRSDEEDDESDLGSDLPVEATGQKKKRETLRNKQKKSESGSSSDIETGTNLSNVRTRRRNKNQDSLREKSTKTKTNKKLSTQEKSSKKMTNKKSELEDDLSTCSSELQDKANKKNVGKLGIGDVNDDERLVTSKRTEPKEKARQKERRNTKVKQKSGTVSEDTNSKRQQNNSNEENESESSSSVVNAIHEDDHLEPIQNDLSEGQVEETPLKNDIHEDDHLEPIQNDLSEGHIEETPLNRRTRNNRKQLITNKTAKNKQQKSGKISKEDKLVEKSRVSDSTNLETVVVEDMPINSKPKKNSIKKSGLTYSDGTNNVTEKFVVTDVTKSTKTRRSRRKLSKTLDDEENNDTESNPRKRSKSLYNPENILLEEPENNLVNSHKSEMTTDKKIDKSKSAKQRHTTLNRRKSSVRFSLGDALSSTSMTNTKSNLRMSILKSSVSPINTKEPEDDSVVPLQVTKTSDLCHTSMGDPEDEFDEHVLPSTKKTSLKRQHEQSIDFYEIDKPMLAESPVSGKHKQKRNRRYKELATSSQDGNKTDVLAYSQFGDEDMLPEHKSTPVADTTGSSDPIETEPTASQDESKRANWTLKFFEVPKKKAFIINPEVYNDGTRRTKRSRVKPLEYWRNERALYSRRPSGGFALSGIMSPTLPTPSPPAAKPKRKAKKKIPQTPHNLSIHANLSDIEEHIEVNPTITVLNSSTNEEVDIDAIATSEMNRFFGPTGKPVTSDDPIAMSKSLYQKSFSAGELLIRPLQKKGLQVVRNDTMVFRIIRGKLAVTIHETTTILESGARFFVPKGNVYNIQNLRNDEAKLDFIQVKSI